jgi:deazaflavin-dependent oxidoreductase (nitroreductase family)
MARKNYSFFHLTIQKIASSRWGAWYFSRTQHHIDRVLLRITGNKKNMTSILAGVPVAIVTTTGAKSGLPRTLPLIYVLAESEPNKMAFVATNWGQKHHPAWYYNLKANPRATCSINGQIGEYVAHEARGEEYDKFWQSAVDITIGFRRTQQRVSGRPIPIMIMTPVEK